MCTVSAKDVALDYGDCPRASRSVCLYAYIVSKTSHRSRGVLSGRMVVRREDLALFLDRDESAALFRVPLVMGMWLEPEIIFEQQRNRRLEI